MVGKTLYTAEFGYDYPPLTLSELSAKQATVIFKTSSDNLASSARALALLPHGRQLNCRLCGVLHEVAQTMVLVSVLALLLE